MISHHYHYWLRTLLGNLELRETIVCVSRGQSIAVRQKGSATEQTFISGTTLRIEDPATLFIDGLQRSESFGSMSARMVSIQVPWDAIASLGFSHEAPR